MNKTITKGLFAIIVNTIVGVILAAVFGIPLLYGALAINLVGCIMPLLPIPKGLRVGVAEEVWTGQVTEHFTHALQNTFLDGVPDQSQYAAKDVIHLNDVNADVKVLINNTTYPLEPKTLNDGDIAISLAKFETEPTSISDDELRAITYDKISTAKSRHGEALAEAMLDKAIHAFAPTENSADTPVLVTTGTLVDGRKMCQRADILALKKELDKRKVPTAGRRLVLCADHVADLLEADQKFRDQYYNYADGVITRMYGFDIYEYVNCPLFTTEGKKKAYGSAPGVGDAQASVFFYVKRMFRAKGSLEMYYSAAKTDPLNKRTLLSFTQYFVAMPQKAKDAVGAIVSGK